jgi:hypothetical protein
VTARNKAPGEGAATFLGVVTFFIAGSACIARGADTGQFWWVLASVPVGFVVACVMLVFVAFAGAAWDDAAPARAARRTAPRAAPAAPASVRTPPQWVRWEADAAQRQAEREVERVAREFDLPYPSVGKFDALVRAEVERERRAEVERLERIAEALRAERGEG